MSRILVVDDDPHILRTLQIMLESDGHEVLTAGSAEAALGLLERSRAEVALVDLQLPGMSGLDLLARLRAQYPGLETIIITAHGTIETAVTAMRAGAFDYLTKPFSPDQVRHRLRQLDRVRDLQNEVVGLKRRVGELPFQAEFLTQNPATLRLLEVARDVAISDANVLIMGESGTGKTLLARLIHGVSHRNRGPFVTVDCASFQEALLDSELFGHRRGAFTGALADKVGKVETGRGGTLFLDEVGEVPLSLQGKLLRFVEERTFERVGDPVPRSVDARIIAATNRDIEAMVREKAFRQDLFFRLAVVDLSIPPLRSRFDDIVLLAREFIVKFARVHERSVVGWDDDVERCLIRYRWPGNVRELAHTIERAVLLCPDRTIRREHLPARLIESRAAPEQGDAFLPLVEVEEQHIRRALALELPLDETARRLGIDPSTLWRKRKKLNI